jgi:hypothetical protein
VVLKRAVVFRKGRSGSTKGFVDSSQSGFLSTESRSDFRWGTRARKQTSPVRGQKTLRQLGETPDQIEKPLCKDSKTLSLFAKPLCGMNGRNSSGDPLTYANPKTPVQPHQHHQHGRIAMVKTSKSTHYPTVALSPPTKVPALTV